jgi:hypothetical protein
MLTARNGAQKHSRAVSFGLRFLKQNRPYSRVAYAKWHRVGVELLTSMSRGTRRNGRGAGCSASFEESAASASIPHQDMAKGTGQPQRRCSLT